MLILIIYTSVDIAKANHQKKLIVYNINKHHALDIISGRQVLCLYDDELPLDITANSFYITPCQTMHRINKWRYQSLSSLPNTSVHIHNKTLLLITNPLPQIRAKDKIKADIVIITNNPKLFVNDVCKVVDCKTIVADNNTSQWKIAKWKGACDSLHIHFHSVSKDGAFVADL